MAERLPGFIVEVKPTKPSSAFAARIIVTPRRTDGSNTIDRKKKIERHVGQRRALGLALALLKNCDGVPEKVLKEVERLEKEAEDNAEE